jgi:hypothetical protein
MAAIVGKHTCSKLTGLSKIKVVCCNTWRHNEQWTVSRYPPHPTTACSRCGETDTLLHRITRGEVGPMIWMWTRARIAAILRVHPQHISEEWTLRPIFHFWPPQRQAAIVRIVAHLVTYQLQTQRRLSLADYIDFLKRARLKEYHRKSKHPLVGRYLEVL